MFRTVALAASLLVLAGCGGSSGREALAETAAKLDKIRSGDLRLRLLVEPRTKEGGEEFGFELSGPFALAEAGELPIARVRYTQIASGQRESATLISTGSEAFVAVGGKTYALPPEQADQLRAAGGSLRSAGGLAQLAIDDWIDDPEQEDGGELGGAETDRITAELDVVRAVNDLLAVAREIGRADVGMIRGAEAERLAESVRSSSFELHTGKEDRLLRRLAIRVEFGLDVPENLRRALGDLVGAVVRFELGIDDPNERVHVQRPARVLPPAELGGG